AETARNKARQRELIGARRSAETARNKARQRELIGARRSAVTGCTGARQRELVLYTRESSTDAGPQGACSRRDIARPKNFSNRRSQAHRSVGQGGACRVDEAGAARRFQRLDGGVALFGTAVLHHAQHQL